LFAIVKSSAGGRSSIIWGAGSVHGCLESHTNAYHKILYNWRTSSPEFVARRCSRNLGMSCWVARKFLTETKSHAILIAAAMLVTYVGFKFQHRKAQTQQHIKPGGRSLWECRPLGPHIGGLYMALFCTCWKGTQAYDLGMNRVTCSFEYPLL
jgi:hypothetical protein